MTTRGDIMMSIPAAPVTCYATRSGGTTLDTASGGGNPFASALIELAGDPGFELGRLLEMLAERTFAKSAGHQQVECIGTPPMLDWTFSEEMCPPRENRVALLLVVSDYTRLAPDLSLEGAAKDERRVAAMLALHGFSVTQGVGHGRSDLLQALSTFDRRSRLADVAVIYSTGHGLEARGTAYLIPGDFPPDDLESPAVLRDRAVSVERMTASAHAARLNLIFFAGCRRQVG
jgi:hypothetical protein